MKRTTMKMKRPSVRGKKGYGYLGHFAKDKYIRAGHNQLSNIIMTVLMSKAKEAQERAQSQQSPTGPGDMGYSSSFTGTSGTPSGGRGGTTMGNLGRLNSLSDMYDKAKKMYNEE